MSRIAIALAFWTSVIIAIYYLLAPPAYSYELPRYDIPIEQQREQFKRDCRRMAPQGAKRATWLASCRREAP